MLGGSSAVGVADEYNEYSELLILTKEKKKGLSAYVQSRDVSLSSKKGSYFTGTSVGPASV